MNKTGHDDPCLCGSGKMYKQCCMPRWETQAATAPTTDKPIPELIQAAMGHHQAGRLPKAEALCQQILRRAPSNPDALHLSGLIAHQVGKNEIAARLISKAISVRPSGPMFNNLGLVFLAQGKLGAAVESYHRAISLKPDSAEVYSNLGNALKAQGRFDMAVESYRRALALKPDYAGAHSNMGGVLKELGKLDAAVESYQRALALKPDYAEAHYNLGNVLKDQGRLDAAAESYQRALVLKPDHAGARNNIGTVFQDQGQLDAAIEHYRKALMLKPDNVEVLNNLGNALKDQGKLDAAVDSFRRVLSLKPDNVEAHNNLGNVLKNQDKLDAAVESFRQAIAFKPDFAKAHHNLGNALLLRGDFREGWHEYEWRVKGQSGNSYLTDPRNPSQVLPRPSTLLPLELDGKRILLIPQQGLGDEIFFLRFAQIAQQKGAWTAYCPSAKIATIVQRAPGLDMVVSDAGSLSNLDHIFSVVDLPLILGMDGVDDIPPPLQLTALPDRVAAIRERLAVLGRAPFLGVTWRAGTKKTANGRAALFKETDIQLLGRTLSTWPGEVLILQRNPRPDEVEDFIRALGRPAHDFSELNENLEDMLALLSQLDEYVGVSNTNMHMMAGLGKTARVLIMHPPEWREMKEGKESPWYPGFQLYRKKPDGNWNAAYSRLTEDLHKAIT